MIIFLSKTPSQKFGQRAVCMSNKYEKWISTRDIVAWVLFGDVPKNPPAYEGRTMDGSGCRIAWTLQPKDYHGFPEWASSNPMFSKYLGIANLLTQCTSRRRRLKKKFKNAATGGPSSVEESCQVKRTSKWPNVATGGTSSEEDRCASCEQIWDLEPKVSRS